MQDLVYRDLEIKLRFYVHVWQLIRDRYDSGEPQANEDFETVRNYPLYFFNRHHGHIQKIGESDPSIVEDLKRIQKYFKDISLPAMVSDLNHVSTILRIMRREEMNEFAVGAVHDFIRK